MTRSLAGLTTILLWLLLLLVPAGHAAAEGPVVLFDQAHGQRFLVERDQPLDLSGLARLFVEQGARVRTSRSAITDRLLHDVDVLIISGPFATISRQETAAIIRFLSRGGKLAAMVHVTPPFDFLFPRLGTAVSRAVVVEQENIINGNPLDFAVKDLPPSPLTWGVTSFAVHGGWALLNTKKDGAAIARTSPRAWLDLNGNHAFDGQDVRQAFAVILTGKVGAGRFVVCGDDAIFQNRFLDGGNRTLARNLARWLCPERQRSI